jgi:AcrR family transcriptional regulator
MTEAAAAIAVRDGLEKVTAKAVAAAIGVFPGLISHYFTADQLVAAAFGHAAAAERDGIFAAAAQSAADPLGELGYIIFGYLDPGQDPVILLWLDAWQASRYRPALRAEVIVQMNEDVRRMSVLITAATDRGLVRPVCGPEQAAVRIFSLIDALDVQAAIRGGGFDDYTDLQAFLIGVVSQILGAPLTRP